MIVGIWVALIRVVEALAERTAVGLVVVVVVGGAYGWSTNSAGLLWLAFIAAGLLFWLAAHDSRRWERP